MTNNKSKEINKNNQKDSARLARIRRLEQQLKANQSPRGAFAFIK